MTTLVLQPLDTLFFRDGRPYNQDDLGQVEAATVFPPHPPTVVGAVRAALARSMGWPGRPWNAIALGSGVNWQLGDEALGPLRFTGPHILHNGEPLFPAPLNLIAGRNDEGAPFIAYLTPSSQALDTDCGAVRLPTPSVYGHGFKTLEGAWLDTAAMTRVLDGSRLSWNRAIPSSCLWRAEPRVGIRRDVARRTTAEGGLYAAAHVRLAPDVTLAVEIEDLREFSIDGNLAPLGGEGRSAWIERQEEVIRLPEAPALKPGRDGVLRYTVTLVTPGDPGERWPGPGEHLRGASADALPGRIVSACTGRTVMVGGWDGLAERPLPLRPLIPAGSIWFLEARADEGAAATEWHGRAIGRAAAWGFGRVLIGRWEPVGEGT